MALGKRRDKQQELLIPTTQLPRSPGHPFYRALNRLLSAAGFDSFAEELCAPHYADGVGRPSIPPGSLRVRVTEAEGLGQRDLEEIPQDMRGGAQVGFRYLAHPLRLAVSIVQILPVVHATSTSVVVFGVEQDQWMGWLHVARKPVRVQPRDSR